MSDVLSLLQKEELKELDPIDFKCIFSSEIGELGSGFQSHVRMADHCELGLVAIKCFIITEGAPQKRKFAKKFEKELLVSQKAMNDHIVQIFGWVQWPGSMGLVMEYMPAGSLGQFIDYDLERLPLKLILRIGWETSDGIACMHNLSTKQRVVHGDLKPENVLLSPDLHCKISDFGCAELISLTGCTISSSARPKNTGLTLAYAAPEKLEDFSIRPKKEQDTYSFGMLLYALLRGCPPFQSKSQESAFIELIKRGDRPKTRPIDELKETLNNDDKQILETLQSILTKCWRQDPSDRPSMIEVRDELQWLLRLQNDAEVLKEVNKVADTMFISIPNADEHQLVPLHLFSPMHGTFAQGNVYNIYNMSHVGQAAIECGTAEFQSAEAGIAETSTKNINAEPSTTTKKKKKKKVKVDQKPIPGKEKAGPSSSAADMDSKLQSARKPTLSEVFESSDTVLPSDVQDAPSLLETYKVSLKDQNVEEAKTMATRVTSMIEGNIDATANQVKTFGKNCRKKKLFLESIAFFDAAFAMFEKLGKTEENLHLMRRCIWEIMTTNIAMIGYDASMKLVVINFVIPLMYEKLHHIEDTSSVSEQFKCHQVCRVLHYIERSESLVDELKESVKIMRFALTRMKDVFKSEVMNYQTYGHLLNNLGASCELTSRFEDVASFYKQAIDVYKAATDFDDEEEKNRSMMTSQKNLRRVQKLKKP